MTGPASDARGPKPDGEAGSSPREAPDWRVAIPETRRRHLRAWLWAIAGMTFLVLVVGGITRLTQSGLSIVEWKPIAGVVPPMDEAAWQDVFDQYRRSPEYRQVRAGMSLADFKVIFFWEYLHRTVARLIGLVFVVPCAVFWLRGYFNPPMARRAVALFSLGALQGLIGWWMVASGLVDRPSVSHYRLAAHLIVAFLIAGGCVWLALDLRVGAAVPRVSAGARAVMVRGLTLVGALLALQVVWGAFVAGLRAGRVYNTFPLMGDRLVPLELLWLEPGIANFVQNPVTVQWVHRVVGTLLLGATLGLFVLVRRRVADVMSRRLNAALAASVTIQYTLGVLALLYYVPVSLGVLHQAAAMIIAGVWVAWVHHVRQLGLAGATHDEHGPVSAAGAGSGRLDFARLGPRHAGTLRPTVERTPR